MATSFGYTVIVRDSSQNPVSGATVRFTTLDSALELDSLTDKTIEDDSTISKTSGLVTIVASKLTDSSGEAYLSTTYSSLIATVSKSGYTSKSSPVVPGTTTITLTSDTTTGGGYNGN